MLHFLQDLNDFLMPILLISINSINLLINLHHKRMKIFDFALQLLHFIPDDS